MPPTCALRPVNPNNACPLRITAAAGTELAGASFGGTVNSCRVLSDWLFFPPDRSLQPEGRHPPRGVAGSGFPPLPKIPHCCLPQESGPCLSPNVAVHPLRPAIDRCLGRPLPHQLANRTRAHPEATGPKGAPPFPSSTCVIEDSCGITLGFPRLSPTSR